MIRVLRQVQAFLGMGAIGSQQRKSSSNNVSGTEKLLEHGTLARFDNVMSHAACTSKTVWAPHVKNRLKLHHATHILDAENPIVAQSEGVIKSASFIGIVDGLAPP